MTDKKIRIPKEFMPGIPKLYRMNECDVVVAYSKREAVNWYFAEVDPGDAKFEIALDCERVKDLSQEMWWNVHRPEELWDRVERLEGNEELIIGRWADSPAFKTTYEWVLGNMTGNFQGTNIDIPGIFCTTEY